MPQASHHAPRVRQRGPSGSAFDQYLLDIRKLPLITDPREERKLALRARRGDTDAAERLVTANLRFVISYVKRFQGHGLDLSELVAIGNEGLLKAVDDASGARHCTACFSGRYPVAVPQSDDWQLRLFEKARA